MGPCLGRLPFSFLLVVLLSRTAAALTLHDVWHLMLPNSPLPAEVTPPPLSRGEVPAMEESENSESASDPETRVDFGTKAWPHVYYSRRDRKGTVDWGTEAWPHVYYSRRDRKGTVDWGTESWPYVYYAERSGRGKGHHDAEFQIHAAAAAAAAAEGPVAFRGGRKLGSEFRV